MRFIEALDARAWRLFCVFVLAYVAWAAFHKVGLPTRYFTESDAWFFTVATALVLCSGSLAGYELAVEGKERIERKRLQDEEVARALVARLRPRRVGPEDTLVIGCENLTQAEFERFRTALLAAVHSGGVPYRVHFAPPGFDIDVEPARA